MSSRDKLEKDWLNSSLRPEPLHVPSFPSHVDKPRTSAWREAIRLCVVKRFQTTSASEGEKESVGKSVLVFSQFLPSLPNLFCLNSSQPSSLSTHRVWSIPHGVLLGSMLSMHSCSNPRTSRIGPTQSSFLILEDERSVLTTAHMNVLKTKRQGAAIKIQCAWGSEKAQRNPPTGSGTRGHIRHSVYSW